MWKTNEKIPASLQTNQPKPQSSNNDLNEARIVTYLTAPQQSLGASEPPQRGDFSASANVAALLGIKSQVTSEETGQSSTAFSTSEEQWPQPATTQLLPQSNTTKSTNSRPEVRFFIFKTTK